MRREIPREVVNLSLEVIHASESAGIVKSQDDFEPECFHSSRRAGLEVALARLHELDKLGFGGPATALRIPGIPFSQEQDVGLHISLYNQPKQDGVQYKPPCLEACAALEGETYSITIEDGALKILNGCEQNDLKVGGCYYVSFGCGSGTTQIANNLKEKVGLPRDDTQEFHLSVATITPTWIPYHTKSARAQRASAEEKSKWQDAFRMFRHGNPQLGFAGFNDDATTEWTTHSGKMAEAGKKNAQIKAKIANLAKSNDGEAQKLEQQIIDIPKTFGFCKTVGMKEKIKEINRPNTQSQNDMNLLFGAFPQTPRCSDGQQQMPMVVPTVKVC